jgi:hypothetical protein
MEALHLVDYQAQDKSRQILALFKKKRYPLARHPNNYLNCPNLDIYHKPFPWRYVSREIMRRKLFCNYPA